MGASDFEAASTYIKRYAEKERAMEANVTIILPSFNVAEYIGECLESVTGQTLKELEIICVDAGSTDGTCGILENFAEKDKRIKLLYSREKSYGSQVNMGLERAGGQYVAILETDDYAEPDMYETLYKTAVQYDLDYAAADFDCFYTFESGGRLFERSRLFGAERPWYGQVLYSDQIAQLRLSDYLLWKGIYNREFLNKNHIRLHESPGAAYQDMGFLQQVKTYAKRAMYIDRSLYRYRRDRAEASSFHLEGLSYYQKEFAWIEEELRLPEKMDALHRQNYLSTMAWAFLGKYDEILKRLGYDWEDRRLQSPCRWFAKRLKTAMEQNILIPCRQNAWYWEELLILMESGVGHARWLSDKDRTSEEGRRSLLHQIGGRPAIIWGCGVYGEKLLLFCFHNGIPVLAFTDNNPDLQGETFYGYEILSPCQAADAFTDAVILVSSVRASEQIRRQMSEMGIADRGIVPDFSGGIWEGVV